MIAVTCANPYMIGVQACPCGRCDDCTLKRRKLWTHRMMLESYKHRANCFATITYNKEHMPKGDTLVPSDAQDFLKRLRQTISPLKIRYYMVGEYGDETQRPHYHFAFFGMDPFLAGGHDGRSGAVQHAWTLKKESLGYSFVGELNEKSIHYVAGYVTKKMNNVADRRLYGRHPEFQRMSLRPGIGATAMDDVASALECDFGLDEIARVGDVPTALSHGSYPRPLGRYLRRMLRRKVGFANDDTPEDAKRRYGLEVSELFKKVRSEDPEAYKKGTVQILIDKFAQVSLNRVTKSKLRTGGKSL